MLRFLTGFLLIWVLSPNLPANADAASHARAEDWHAVSGDGKVVTSGCIGSNATLACTIDTVMACGTWHSRLLYDEKNNRYTSDDPTFRDACLTDWSYHYFNAYDGRSHERTDLTLLYNWTGWRMRKGDLPTWAGAKPELTPRAGDWMIEIEALGCALGGLDDPARQPLACERRRNSSIWLPLKQDTAVYPEQALILRETTRGWRVISILSPADQGSTIENYWTPDRWLLGANPDASERDPDWHAVSGDGMVQTSECLGDNSKLNCIIDTIMACSAWNWSRSYQAGAPYHRSYPSSRPYVNEVCQQRWLTKFQWGFEEDEQDPETMMIIYKYSVWKIAPSDLDSGPYRRSKTGRFAPANDDYAVDITAYNCDLGAMRSNPLRTSISQSKLTDMIESADCLNMTPASYVTKSIRIQPPARTFIVRKKPDGWNLINIFLPGTQGSDIDTYWAPGPWKVD